MHGTRGGVEMKNLIDDMIYLSIEEKKKNLNVDKYGQVRIDNYSVNSLSTDKLKSEMIRNHINSGASRFRLQKYTNGRFEYDVIK